MSKHYDVIVTGVGSMGSAACWYLAKRGYTVLGIEQFDIPHEQGAHAGQSRLIRKAYYEHASYVALLERAYHNWLELEQETASKVYYRTGILYFGDPGSELVKGTSETAAKCNIPLEIYSHSDAASKYSMFKFSDHFKVMFEPEAGFITPEKCVALYTSDAIRRGARIQAREKVISWNDEGSHITVHTNRGRYKAERLIVSAGAWTTHVIPELPANLKVTKVFIAWMKPDHWDEFTLGNFPCWFMNDDDGSMFYGFPILPPKDFAGPIGLKLSRHKMGEEVDPDNVNRNIEPGDEKVMVDFLTKYIPAAAGNLLAMKTCLYTNTTDSNFILDHVPGTDKKVAVAAGFSGHGFKFSSAIGEIMADLAIKGGTELPIHFLRLKRFANQNR